MRLATAMAKRVTTGPSDHPSQIIGDPTNDLYLLEFHGEVEQSAIYGNVDFLIVGRRYGIILTAQCEITQSTGDSVLLAPLLPAMDVMEKWLINPGRKKPLTLEEARGETRVSKSKSNRSDTISNFANSFLRNNTYGYHFLPEIEGAFPHSFVSFGHTALLRIRDLGPGEKVCVLKHPFRSAVPSRFAAFAGRIGTPEFGKKYLVDIATGLCKIRND